MSSACNFIRLRSAVLGNARMRSHNGDEPMTLKPAYTVNQFCEAFGVGRTRFYDLVNAGELKTRKNGGRTIVRGDDAQAWLDSLPAVEPKEAA